MILTRCPACQKVFRVRPEHLRAHQGAVRCGHCYATFNALEHLLENLPGAATTAGTAPAQPQAGTEQALSPAAPAAPAASPSAPEQASLAQPSPAATEPMTSTETEPSEAKARSDATPGAAGRDFFVLEEPSKPPAEEDAGAALRFEIPEPPGETRPADAPTAAESTLRDRRASTFDDLANRLEFGLPDSFLTPAPAAVRSARAPHKEVAPPASGIVSEPPKPESREDTVPPDFFDLPGLRIPEAEPTLQPLDEWRPEPDYGAMTEPVPPPAATEASFEPALRAGSPAEPAAASEPIEPSPPQTPYIPDDTPPLEHLDAAYGPPPAPPSGRRWLWGLGIGVLLGALAVQAAYVFRSEITRDWPLLRPVYEAVCARLGCDIPLPRIAGAISIESSDLQSDPAEGGRFVLNALVRNRAPHAQALPHLELTLTDARDRPLVRRVFAPAEWVPHSEIDRGFLPGEELAAHLPFTAPGVDASGYRVYVFYP